MSLPSTWNRARYQRQHPLTARFVRTLAEADSDPRAWLEGPDGKPPVDEPSPKARKTRRVDNVCWCLAVALLALLAIAVMRHPG